MCRGRANTRWRCGWQPIPRINVLQTYPAYSGMAQCAGQIKRRAYAPMQRGENSRSTNHEASPAR